MKKFQKKDGFYGKPVLFPTWKRGHNVAYVSGIFYVKNHLGRLLYVFGNQDQSKVPPQAWDKAKEISKKNGIPF